MIIGIEKGYDTLITHIPLVFVSGKIVQLNKREVITRFTMLYMHHCRNNTKRLQQGHLLKHHASVVQDF